MKSILSKTLATILPMVLITLIVVSYLSYAYSKSMLMEQIDMTMTEQLNSTIQRIDNHFMAHSKTAEIFARTVEHSASEIPLSQYDRMIENALRTNEDTFGLGIYFEPNRYDNEKRYVSTYGYRDENGIVFTQQYSDPAYDYLNQAWYLAGKNTDKPYVYTNPYHDPDTSVTMTSTVVPVIGTNSELFAMVSADIDLTTIQQIVENTQVGQSGWAVLLDTNNQYIAGPETELMIEKPIEQHSNASLASLSESFKNDPEGKTTYSEDSGIHHVFYKKIPQTGWTLLLVMPDKELTAPLSKQFSLMLIISLIGILVITLTILLYSHYVARNLKKVNQLAGALSEGDFTHILRINSKDELGQMAVQFNNMIGQVQGMLGEVTGHSERVSMTSEQLIASAEQTSKATEMTTAAMQEVAEGSELQVKSSEEAVRAMEEISEGIHRIAQSSASVSESSQMVSTKTDEGNTIIQKTIQQMHSIQQAVDLSVHMMDRLNIQSQEIDNIIDVISSISSQTKLLALNAAIEAARAGEYGKGFAVVSNEVGKLAKQTLEAAEQVSSVIESIQLGINQAVKAIHEGNAEVNKGTKAVQAAGEIFQGIQTEMADVTIQIQEVSAASEQMSAGSEQVTAAIKQLSNIATEAASNAQSVAAASEEQLASMEEVSMSANTLNRLAQELHALINRFKINSRD